MIKIIKGESRDIIVTLNENQTLTNPDFLFEFTNDTTGETKIFTQFDSSEYPERYNLFVITDSTTELPYNGQMDFSPVGYWSYNIYETVQASPNSLVVPSPGYLLESGKVWVVDNTASTDMYFDDEDNINNVCFDEPD